MQRPDPGGKRFSSREGVRISYFFDLSAPAIYPNRGVGVSMINFASLPDINPIDAGITRRRGDASEFCFGKGALGDKPCGG